MGGKITDLVGREFGRLTVVSLGERIGERQRIAWSCLCICGNSVNVTGESLKSGMVKSCGCLRLDSLASRAEIFQKNMLQKTFGRLTVLRHLGVGPSGSVYECRCECGKITSVPGSCLNGEHTTSCGCYHREIVAELKTTHGLSDHPLYDTWNGMIQRCMNPNVENYRNYGGRETNPVEICNEWLGSPEKFIDWSTKNGWSPELTIDRRDNEGNYEPSNCRWVTSSEQNRNKRNAIITNEIADAIRVDPRRNIDIAESYGVSPQVVSQIKRGITWRKD